MPKLMAHSHCAGPGTGPGLGTMGLCILLHTVHTTQGQGQGQGTGTGTIGFHTHFSIPGPSVKFSLTPHCSTPWGAYHNGFPVMISPGGVSHNDRLL